MIALVRQFIEAQQTGNWELHLDTIQRMLAYFLPAGTSYTLNLSNLPTTNVWFERQSLKMSMKFSQLEDILQFNTLTNSSVEHDWNLR